MGVEWDYKRKPARLLVIIRAHQLKMMFRKDRQPFTYACLENIDDFTWRLSAEYGWWLIKTTHTITHHFSLRVAGLKQREVE